MSSSEAATFPQSIFSTTFSAVVSLAFSKKQSINQPTPLETLATELEPLSLLGLSAKLSNLVNSHLKTLTQAYQQDLNIEDELDKAIVLNSLLEKAVDVCKRLNDPSYKEQSSSLWSSATSALFSVFTAEFLSNKKKAVGSKERLLELSTAIEKNNVLLKDELEKNHLENTARDNPNRKLLVLAKNRTTKFQSKFIETIAQQKKKSLLYRIGSTLLYVPVALITAPFKGSSEPSQELVIDPRSTEANDEALEQTEPSVIEPPIIAKDKHLTHLTSLLSKMSGASQDEKGDIIYQGVIEQFKLTCELNDKIEADLKEREANRPTYQKLFYFAAWAGQTSADHTIVPAAKFAANTLYSTLFTPLKHTESEDKQALALEGLAPNSPVR